MEYSWIFFIFNCFTGFVFSTLWLSFLALLTSSNSSPQRYPRKTLKTAKFGLGFNKSLSPKYIHFFPLGGAQKVLQCLAFVKAYQPILPAADSRTRIRSKASSGKFLEVTTTRSWLQRTWSVQNIQLHWVLGHGRFGPTLVGWSGWRFWIWTMWVSMFGIPCQVKLGQLGIGTSHATRTLLTTFLPLGN